MLLCLLCMATLGQQCGKSPELQRNGTTGNYVGANKKTDDIYLYLYTYVCAYAALTLFVYVYCVCIYAG